MSFAASEDFAPGKIMRAKSQTKAVDIRHFNVSIQMLTVDYRAPIATGTSGQDQAPFMGCPGQEQKDP